MIGDVGRIANGLSGCKLELLSDKTIRKTSASILYNNRLITQANKQSLFSNMIIKNIDAPKILNINYGELYSFDMEYIPGHSASEYLATANIIDIEFITETLFNYIDSLLYNSKSYQINNQLQCKIESLKSNSLYKDFLEYLHNFVNSQCLYVPKTFCHGDLTFANIIFHKNRLFFIDFLDSYIDSVVCDIIKLKQELYHFWYLKNNQNDSLRIEQIYRLIWKKIENKYNIYINTDTFLVLDVLNSLRIEPYLTNDEQCSILDYIIKGSKLYEQFDNSNGRKVF